MFMAKESRQWPCFSLVSLLSSLSLSLGSLSLSSCSIPSLFLSSPHKTSPVSDNRTLKVITVVAGPRIPQEVPQFVSEASRAQPEEVGLVRGHQFIIDHLEQIGDQGLQLFDLSFMFFPNAARTEQFSVDLELPLPPAGRDA